MTPDDLSSVERTWSELRCRRDPLLAELTRRFQSGIASGLPADVRAAWLLSAVDELVGLLSVPSRLAERARDLGETWPDPLTAPCFAVEGQAWMGAAGECLASWTPENEAAWRQAWLLLSDVLAAETLSPFADVPRPDAAG